LYLFGGKSAVSAAAKAILENIQSIGRNDAV